MLEALAQVLAEHPDEPRTACGDHNTPQVELPSGEVVTWAQEVTSRERGSVSDFSEGQERAGTARSERSVRR